MFFKEPLTVWKQNYLFCGICVKNLSSSFTVKSVGFKQSFEWETVFSRV